MFCRAIKNATNNGYVCVAAVKEHVTVGGVIDRTQSVHLLTYYISIYSISAAYDDINLVTDSGYCLLQSAADRTCVVPCTHNIFGDDSFAAVSQQVWNSLPSYHDGSNDN